MSSFRDAFNLKNRLSRRSCACGAHGSQAEHDAAAAADEALRLKRVVEGAVMRAIFPADAERRRFLQAVGATAASAAIAAAFPIATATDVFAQGAAPEKKDLKIGFIPITCATPIIMASPMGFLRQAGPQRGGHQDSGLGGDPRQDAEQGI